MQCELCGKETDYSRNIMLEGAKIEVCGRCANHGTVVNNPTYRGPANRPRRLSREPVTMDVVEDCAELVRNARSSRGWKQEDLAKKVSEPESLISRIEKGTDPSEKVVKKLEKVLKITLLETSHHEQIEFKKEKSTPTTLGDVVKIKRRGTQQ